MTLLYFVVGIGVGVVGTLLVQSFLYAMEHLD